MSTTAATATAPLTQLSAWKALQTHQRSIASQSFRDLFAKDPNRGTRFAVEAEGVYLDYSKHRITDETIKLLLQLAEESDVKGRKSCGAARRSSRAQRHSHQGGRQKCRSRGA
jgi:glucose-6-phosphate isomerase